MQKVITREVDILGLPHVQHTRFTRDENNGLVIKEWLTGTYANGLSHRVNLDTNAVDTLLRFIKASEDAVPEPTATDEVEDAWGHFDDAWALLNSIHAQWDDGRVEPTAITREVAEITRELARLANRLAEVRVNDEEAL